MHRYEYKTLWSNHATAADTFPVIEAFLIDFIMKTSWGRDPALIIVSENELFAAPMQN
jgi:hypothetical protein